MGPHLGNNLLNLGIYDESARGGRRVGTRLCRTRGLRGRARPRQWRAWAVSPRASSTRWPRWRFPPSATASATSSASSNRRSSTAGRSERTDKWLRYGNAWEIPPPGNGPFEVKLGGSTETYNDHEGRSRVRWVPNRVVLGVPYEHPDSRLPRQHGQHLAPVACRSARVVRFRRLQ